MFPHFGKKQVGPSLQFPLAAIPGMMYWTFFAFSASFSERRQLAAKNKMMDEMNENPTLIHASM